MTNVLLGIIGVIFFIGLAIASVSFFGPNLGASKVDAQATDYLNQSSQIARAIEQYSSDNGKLPMVGTTEPVDTLVSSKYMTSKPPGGSSPWIMSASANALLTPAAGDAADAMKVCVAARKRAGMGTPATVLKCDGTTGALSKLDPCCLM